MERFFRPLLLLLLTMTIHNVLGDPCSFWITDRVGSLQSPTFNSTSNSTSKSTSSANATTDCPGITYYFQSTKNSHWALSFSSLQAADDTFVFYDGADKLSPVILQSASTSLFLYSAFISTGSYITMQVVKPSQSYAQWSVWLLQFTNYEENTTVLSPVGFETVAYEGDWFEFGQIANGIAEDYVGSTWVFLPDDASKYMTNGLSITLYLDNFQDTTGTLRITVVYGSYLQVFDADDLRRTAYLSFTPASETDAIIYVYSSVRTQPGSFSSFSLQTVGDNWWSSTSSGVKHPAGILIVVGILLGIGFIIGVSIAIMVCYKKKTGTAQYKRQVDVMMTPMNGFQTANSNNNNYPQPVYIVMTPPQQQQHAVAYNPTQTQV